MQFGKFHDSEFTWHIRYSTLLGLFKAFLGFFSSNYLIKNSDATCVILKSNGLSSLTIENKAMFLMHLAVIVLHLSKPIKQTPDLLGVIV